MPQFRQLELNQRHVGYEPTALPLSYTGIQADMPGLEARSAYCEANWIPKKRLLFSKQTQ